MEGNSLIVCIVNKGFTDLVMEAARDAGAKGGTVFTARGTGNREIEKFYGIEIKPEKEIVYIVAANDIKEKILKAIYKSAGLDTQGQGIVFSLPVEDLVLREEPETK